MIACYEKMYRERIEREAAVESKGLKSSDPNKKLNYGIIISDVLNRLHSKINSKLLS